MLIKTKVMKEEERIVQFSIDDMSIKSHLYYNINKDEIIGLINYGQCNRSNQQGRPAYF